MSPRSTRRRKSKSAKKRSLHRGSKSRYRAAPHHFLQTVPTEHRTQALLDLLDRNQGGEANPYGADGVTTHQIPALAISGRSGHRNSFRGVFDLDTGKLRIDNKEDLEFWLEIDFNYIPFFRYQPGGEGYEESASNFESMIPDLSSFSSNDQS